MPGETPTRLVPEQASRPVAPPSPAPGASARFGGAPSPDDWEALSTIGEGGMGLVLLARDRRLGRLVALKRLKPECRSDPAVRARFLREARAQAALASSHVVHIYAIGEDADGPWLAMEYVASALPPPAPGAPNPPQTLEQKISADGVMRPREALSMVLRIGRAMEQAHAAGVVHRDLKPANILIDRAGEPKVADFGLARIERGAGSGGSSVAAALTVSGEKLLSLGYGAPEQEIDASRCDARTDVYGLGAILFFCLAGRNPRFFREDDLPVFLRPLLAKALATDPSRRHQTAAAFDAEAAALLADAKSAVPTVRTTWRCKWCGTVNPLEKRFCDGCGWDGMAHCLECNAEMRFGIQFCGVCGANQAAYETAANNLARIEKACAERDFPHAVALAAAPLALEPSGPAGSRLLASIRERGAEARRAVERRDKLREIIPMEMQARNYERAELFMDEMDRLSSAPEDDHSKERRDMPALRETRDLARIERALRERDRALAERLLASLPSATPEGRVRADRARAALRRRARALRAARAAGFAALLAAVFLVATPAAMLVSGPGPSPAWAPYLAVASLPRVGGVAAAWAAIWGVEDLSAYESKAK